MPSCFVNRNVTYTAADEAATEKLSIQNLTRYMTKSAGQRMTFTVFPMLIGYAGRVIFAVTTCHFLFVRTLHFFHSSQS